MTFTKTPKVIRPKHHAPVITSVKKATNTGLRALRQSARKVPSKTSASTARKSKIGYKDL
jgi:hypothetical protein